MAAVKRKTMIDRSLSLKEIYTELCRGNIDVITLQVNRFIAEMSLKLYDPSAIVMPDYNEQLMYLILICNILYNRTSISVLPVEDGLYDILLERYKAIDPNFQVGSVVVDFNQDTHQELLEVEDRPIVKPIKFLERSTDEIRQKFEHELIKFDMVDKYNFNDIFYDNPLCIPSSAITKRKHNTAHNHPTLVGTLDKCKFVLDADALEKDVYGDPSVKILERDWFRKHIDAGIITEDQQLTMILELKYDGISVEADCTDEVVSARTRGDTNNNEASDITPILKGYKFTRNEVLKDRNVGVKFEAIMTNYNLQRFNIARGYNYANCRTAIIGLFGSSDAYLYRDYITLVPLALDIDDVPEVGNRLEEIELLNRVYKTKGQPLRYTVIQGDYKTCLFLIKKFAEEAVAAREYLDFMFDGIVVSYADSAIRTILGRENNINKYQMAVKFDPSTKLTTFLGYTYEVGQNGQITPMIHYNPVEFFGTIHNKSTGSSLKRFNDLKLKIGDTIQVTYMNDVMPYVTSIDCEDNRRNPNPYEEFPKFCPVCGSRIEIQSSGKTAICTNLECKGRKISRMTNMLSKLNLKGFAEAAITQLDVYSFNKLFNLTEEELQILGPTNASNFITAMNELKKTPIEDYRLLGSLGFTNIASKTWKLIFTKYNIREFVSAIEFEPSHFYNTICSIKGIGSSIADTIMSEYKYFKDDIYMIINEFTVIESRNVSLGKQIRFSGCRHKEFAAFLRSKGLDADCEAGVTKNTDILIVPYEGFQSTKVSKVGPNCIIVPISEFAENYSKYI